MICKWLTAAILVMSPLDARNVSTNYSSETKDIPGWGKVVDEEGDCEFKADKGKLTIIVPGTQHDFDPRPGFKNNGPRVLQEVEGDFIVEVKVTGTIAAESGTELPGRNLAFRAGTLLIWQDKSNFIRLDRGGLFKNGKAVSTAYFHVFKNEKRVVEQAPVIKDEPTYLHVERKGDVIKAYVRQGETKRTFPSQKMSLPAKVQIALGAVNASSRPLEIEFSEFSITKSVSEKKD